MHTGPMAEHEGKFGRELETQRTCPVCAVASVKVRIWESSDGAYEDEQFRCGACGYTWWVDGIDS